MEGSEPSPRSGGTAGPESSVRLLYAGRDAQVSCADPAVLAWLVEFVGPALELSHELSAAPDHHVGFGIVPELHAGLRQALSDAPEQRVEGFTLDGSFSPNPAFESGGWLWFQDPRHGAFVGSTDEGRRVRVVAPSDDPYHRVTLMRVVRELATCAAHLAGMLPLHAAGFVAGSGAVLVCGRKRAGKTSVLVHALQRGGRFLSNDRVWVSPDDLRARGMPTIVMLRNGTLELFDGLCRDFERQRFDRARTLAECAPGADRPEPQIGHGFDRPGISPAQLCRLLNAPMQGHAPVTKLLFPRIDPGVRGLALDRIAPAEAAELLRESLLKPSHPTRLSEPFARKGARAPVPPELEDERCRCLAAAIPAWTCRLGRDAYEQDLIAALRSVEGASALRGAV